MFAQQELDSCWVLLFVDRQAPTCRSHGVLAHLHVWLKGRADFAYSSSSLASMEQRRPIGVQKSSDDISNH